MGLYPIFFPPDKIEGLYDLSRFYSVIIHYSIVFVFFFIFPAIILKYFYHEKIKEYGMNFNNFSRCLKLVLFLVPILVVLCWFSAKNVKVINEYPLVKNIPKSMPGKTFGNIYLFLVIELFYFLYYIGWEFLFRGFIVLGLVKCKLPVLVPIVIQTIASTLLHYNKPETEILMALTAGFILGYFVYKYKTIWFAVLIHFITGLLIDIFVIIRN